MSWKTAALFAIVTAAGAAPAASPKDSRIALRYGVGQVLIMGGEIALTDEATSNALTAIHDKYPKLVKVVAGEWMNAVPPQVLQKFEPNPRTGWRIGDRWQLYPGAGPPVTLVIETVVIIGHGGCGCVRDGALARFLSPASANRIAGLRAGEYLVAPGVGLANVSQAPLYPLEGESDVGEKIRKALFGRAREVVKDENWEIAGKSNLSEKEKGRIQELNRSFLSIEDTGISIRAQRWAPPGEKPLLFALALWFSEIEGKQRPVFAGEAILEEGFNTLKVLSFQYREAEWMRVSEFASWTWDFDGLSGFLNAWKIGNRHFFARQLNGYEFAGVGVQELDLTRGVVDTDLGYAF